MMALVMPMCPALFVYLVSTTTFPCGIQVVCLLTALEVAPGICGWTKGGTGLQGYRQLTLFGAAVISVPRLLPISVWTPISNAISATTLHSENKHCCETYSIDQYACSYQGSCTKLTCSETGLS